MNLAEGRRLAVCGAILLSLASCSGDADTSAPPAASPPAASPPKAAPPRATATLEQQAHAKINEYRVKSGLPALTWNDVIAEQARLHARSMAAGATPVGHEGMDDRLAIIRQAVPWSGAAENVATSRTIGKAVDDWLNSPVHRSHIEGDFDLTGIGTATDAKGTVYVTQILIKSFGVVPYP
ncbi:MAG TPA: CAP domain-containing protein [Vicinamibacterales bacterium]|nr:CAP domain-containing protein [Vicinamibacterales bacterium]